MALIVEDGSVVAGAESYCSVAFATTYHANRGNTAWAAIATDTIREELLRKATEYTIQKYRMRWSGFRLGSLQLLDWPRSYVPIPDVIQPGHGAYVSISIIPEEVKNACAELALRAIVGDLLGDLSQQKIHSEVGPIKVTYDKFSAQSIRYSAIDGMLSPYLKSGSNTVQTVRR